MELNRSSDQLNQESKLFHSSRVAALALRDEWFSTAGSAGFRLNVIIGGHTHERALPARRGRP